uniref:Uncharacterized protein n=1 Tax=Anguilla anguilla TaxID=7936 RepID=A0A0E9PQT2_ANGAN
MAISARDSLLRTKVSYKIESKETENKKCILLVKIRKPIA